MTDTLITHSLTQHVEIHKCNKLVIEFSPHEVPITSISCVDRESWVLAPGCPVGGWAPGAARAGGCGPTRDRGDLADGSGAGWGTRGWVQGKANMMPV